MPVGRKPLVDRPKALKIYIPESLHTKVHLLLLDPVTVKPKYGSLSGLIKELLAEWLKTQQVTYDGSEHAAGPGGPGAGSEGTAGPEDQGTREGGDPGGRVREGAHAA